MADDKKPTPNKKIVDVAHPGESAPSPNSKSVIITHRPTVKDPMVNEAKSDTEGSEPSQSLSRTHQTVLQPLPSTDAETPEPKTEETAPAEPTDTPEPEPVAAPTPAPEPKPAPETAVKPPEQTSTGTSATVGTKDVQTESEAAVAEDEAAKYQEKLDAMVESKQFYLPINTIEHRRTKQFIVLGAILSVVLALVWLDIALDSGLLHIDGVKPLTNFFNQG